MEALMNSIETILSRMMAEKTFAEAVFANAEKALAEYSLSAEELARFKSLSKADFEAMSTEDRKSFGWSNHNETVM
jgi:exopolysaccharide biosynthesis protein